jgi:hypothetical protein
MIARRITAQILVKPDASVMASVSAGQPVSITNLPTGGQDFSVKVCADGARPDMIVTQAIDYGGTNIGQAVPRNSPALLVLLGGAVVAGDLLKVSSGKLIKCGVGDQGWLRALQAGAANDLINAEASDKVA